MARLIKWRGDDYDLLPKEQAGGRKHHQADVICACKTIMWDIVRQKKIPAGLSSNDAKACYDRTIYAVILLCVIAWKIAEEFMCCALNTLFLMSSQVKTAHGISAIQYGGPYEPVPHHRAGQGLSLIHI